MPATLASVPEEVLERILDLVITPPSPNAAPRPAWHRYSSSSSSSGSSRPSSPVVAVRRIPPHLAPLFVCRMWLRIATPLQYRHIVLRYTHQAALLAETLREAPELGRWTRSIRVEGTFDALGDIAPLCPSVETFDMTVDNGTSSASSPPGDARTEPEASESTSIPDERLLRFCASLGEMPNIKHLIIHKNAYLTQPRPSHVFEQLSKAISRWEKLELWHGEISLGTDIDPQETVNIAFRFSPSPTSSLSASLASAPNLRVVRALLPAVWNTTLLEISENPSLERIQLTPDSELMGAHLFLSEARKHPRLMELIRAGTPIMRTRANTTSAASTPRTSSPSPSPQGKTPRVDPRTAPSMLPVPAASQRNSPNGRRMSSV